MARFSRRTAFDSLNIDQVMGMQMGIYSQHPGRANLPMSVANAVSGSARKQLRLYNKFNNTGSRKRGNPLPSVYKYMNGVMPALGERVVFRHNFMIDKGRPPLLSAISQYKPGLGELIIATAPGAKFGFRFGISTFKYPIRLVFAATKLIGTFEKWVGGKDDATPLTEVPVNPSEAKTGFLTSIVSTEPHYETSGQYGLYGDVNVSVQDAFIVHWMAVIAKTDKYDFQRIVQPD